MLDKEYFAATVAQLDTAMIEYITPDLKKDIRWMEMLQFMRMALKYKEQLGLEFDAEIWGYGLMGAW